MNELTFRAFSGYGVGDFTSSFWRPFGFREVSEIPEYGIEVRVDPMAPDSGTVSYAVDENGYRKSIVLTLSTDSIPPRPRMALLVTNGLVLGGADVEDIFDESGLTTRIGRYLSSAAYHIGPKKDFFKPEN